MTAAAARRRIMHQASDWFMASSDSVSALCPRAVRNSQPLRSSAMVKTDRNDARAIAQAIRVGWFTAVHVKSAESQELRLLLTNRKTLLTGRVMLENEIRGTLKAFGLKVGRVPVATFEARVIELTADHRGCRQWCVRCWRRVWRCGSRSGHST